MLRIIPLFLLFFISAKIWAYDQQYSELPDQIVQEIKKYEEASAQFKSEDKYAEAASFLDKIANIYWENKHLEKAFNYLESAIELYEKSDHISELANAYGNCGLICNEQGRNKEAIRFFLKKLKLNRKSGDMYGNYKVLIQLSITYDHLNKNRKAVKELEGALKIAQKLGNINMMRTCYAMLSENYKKLKDEDKSIEYIRLYSSLDNYIEKTDLKNVKKQSADQLKAMRDHIHKAEEEMRLKNEELYVREETIREIEQVNYENELEIEVLQKDKELQTLLIREKESRLEFERTIRIFLLGGFLLISTLTFFLFRAQNTIRKQNFKLQSYNQDLEKQVKFRTQKLQKANNELVHLNNDLDTLVYKSSHDLKGPLSRLEGLCNLALLDIKDKTGKDHIKNLQGEVDKMQTIIDQISKLRDVKLSKIQKSSFLFKKQVNEILNELSILPQYEKVKLSINIPSKLKITTDYDLFKIILTNLIKNAFQFSIYDQPGHKPYIGVSVENLSNKIRVIVKDNGEGIPKSLVGKIFNMFFKASLRSEGAGLGLYTSKMAAIKLKGKILYDRVNENENIFSVIVPV